MTRLKKQRLGSTGIQLSSIGLGTVKFGRDQGVKYPAEFTIPSLDVLGTLLETAWDCGINYLDTAPAYGQSEVTLGTLLRKSRHNWIVSTKVGEYFDQGISSFDFSKSKTIESVEKSLQLLGKDTLDIVFVHSSGNDKEVIQETDVLPTLLELKRRGMIQAIGYSGKNARQTSLALELCDVFMVTLNQQDLSQTDLIQKCQQHDKGVVIKKALASGHASSPNSAIRFASTFPGVTSVIVGTINESHLKQNIDAAVATNK